MYRKLISMASVLFVTATLLIMSCQEHSAVDLGEQDVAAGPTNALNTTLDVEKGEFTVEMGYGFIGGREIHIREESMCEGSAQLKIKWNKTANKVRLLGKFDGLPYRMDLAYDYPVSTPYNEYPDAVEDGKWQIWFAGRVLSKTTTFYYDAGGLLLGNEFEITPPADAIPLEVPVVQMICTPMFESNPADLRATVDFEFSYDALLDAAGTAGVYATGVPTDLNDPTSIIGYYTDGGLPVAEAMNFEDVINDINNGGGVMFATSLEPDPKPAYLIARDNLMIGWGADYPAGSAGFMGLPVDLTPYGDCGTFQLPDPF